MEVIDVEKMKKMNSLVKEFKKHGMNADSTEATNQIKGMLYKQAPEQREMQGIHAAESVEGTELIEQKYQLLLEMNNKRFQQEIEALKTALNNLGSELQMLKAELKRVAEQPLQKPKEKDKQEVLKTVPNEAHPRQGNYKPEDVSIEKMFYFGNGRK